MPELRRESDLSVILSQRDGWASSYDTTGVGARERRGVIGDAAGSRPDLVIVGHSHGRCAIR